jgi:hypothetical protein
VRKEKEATDLVNSVAEEDMDQEEEEVDLIEVEEEEEVDLIEEEEEEEVEEVDSIREEEEDLELAVDLEELKSLP